MPIDDKFLIELFLVSLDNLTYEGLSQAIYQLDSEKAKELILLLQRYHLQKEQINE